MAEKGDRIRLESVARQMYVDGQTLTAISEALDVSPTSLTAWKARTKAPNDELDEWDKARRKKSDHYQRMQALFDRQMTYVEDQPPHLLTAPMVDSLSKLGALVERVEKITASARKQALNDAAVAVEKAAKQQGLNKEQAQFWREQVLGVGQ